MLTISHDDPVAVAAVDAIRGGDVEGLKRLLREHPNLVTARIEHDRGDGNPPIVHAAPQGDRLARPLPQRPRHRHHAGPGRGRRQHPLRRPHTETPLHWAASSDDIDALSALIDAGADIEAPGAVIAGGTPLDDAVAFGQWRAARRLVERGARTALWHAAALGIMDPRRWPFAGTPLPRPYPWGGPPAPRPSMRSPSPSGAPATAGRPGGRVPSRPRGRTRLDLRVGRAHAPRRRRP